MDKESIIYDTATISDIPELVRLRLERKHRDVT